jgi:phenylalanyl-tRNA synthetase alpha subunit
LGFLLQDKYLVDTANKLNNALTQIVKLRNIITAMDLKHKEEVEKIRAGGCKSNNEIEILQDRLALEQGKAASLKTSVNALKQELQSTTLSLLSILNDEHSKSKALSEKASVAEKTRLEDMQRYNEKLKFIKETIEQIQEINLNQMITKIDYQARESIWLVSQLNRLMRDKKSLIAK